EVQADTMVDWSKAAAAHARADRLNRIATAADQKAEQAERIANEETARSEEAAYKAAEAKQAVLDASLVVNDAREFALQSQTYATQTKTQLEQLIYLQEHPPGSHYFSGDMKYYHWDDNTGNSGRQFVQPLYFGYWQQDFSYGLYTKYITSQNKTIDASGRVNTLSDTTLIISKRNEKPRVIVDYALSVNIPTGKSALSWRNDMP
ncbi:MAG: hypothetical protein K0R22_3135, partial [Sporomusa sp.]|nr:hypothetical protein [Sporomusa sp.]